MSAHLYVLVGAPGSGKSTWAHNKIKTLFTEAEYVYVSRDSIRFNMVKENEDYFSKEKIVYEEMIRQIVKGLREELNVFVDATHLNHSSREKLINAINKYYTHYVITFVFFDVCLAVCLRRNRERSGRALVPEDKVVQMFDRMVSPDINEFPNCVGIWTVRE